MSRWQTLGLVLAGGALFLSHLNWRIKKRKGRIGNEKIIQERKEVLENKELLEKLREEVMAWCGVNGLLLGKDHDRGYFSHAPVTLLPSLIPKEIFFQLHSLALIFNKLIDRVSRDYEFLISSLNAAALVDTTYLGRFVRILKIVHQEGETQPIRLGIQRTDFMLQRELDKLSPIQVECNTIAAGFGCLADKTADLHRFLISRYFRGSALYNEENLAVTRNAERIPDALATAAKHHPKYNAKNSVILMIVHGNDPIICDQRFTEYHLWERHGISLIRRSLTYIEQNGILNQEKDLLIDGFIVLVSYFRSGYSPREFPSETQWNALLKIERSRSIKCPSVAYHLSGTKKIQQVLALPGRLERFLTKSECEQIRETFTGQWGLDSTNTEVQEVIEQALVSPQLFVLKPQREGGGNNLWGADLIRALQAVDTRSAYILMQIIKNASNPVAILREGKVEVAMCVHELGIYSAFIGDGNKNFLNTSCGHLFRTKKEGINEGGISSGTACSDTPLLY